MTEARTPRRRLTTRATTAVVGALAGSAFPAAWGGLWSQMANGHDPALGAQQAPARNKPKQEPAKQPQTVAPSPVVTRAS